MYISLSTLLVSTLSLASTISALQTIYVGIKDEDCGSGSIKGGRYYIWFSDSDPCSSDALITGYPGYGTDLCEDTYTLLGHTGLTFTGCPHPAYSTPWPTDVSDGGNPALVCEPVSVPDVQCPNDCGFQDPMVI